MRIRMYNVGFGDCFCIRDRKSSLLVELRGSQQQDRRAATERGL